MVAVAAEALLQATAARVVVAAVAVVAAKVMPAAGQAVLVIVPAVVGATHRLAVVAVKSNIYACVVA